MQLLLKRFFQALVLMLSAAVTPMASAAVTSCSLSTTGIAFNPYSSVTRATVDAIGYVTVSCNGSGSDSLQLRLAGGSNNQCSGRRMVQGASFLSYDLFTDSQRSSIFCDGFGQGIPVEATYAGPGVYSANFSFYGRIPSNQLPQVAGSYTDSLTMTLQTNSTVHASVAVPISTVAPNSCYVTTTPLSFGEFKPPTDGDKSTSASVTVTCTAGGNYSVALGGGLNASGSTRRMTRQGNPSSTLSYFVYADAARTTPWGDDSILGPQVNSSMASGISQSLTVFGRMQANPSAIPGLYSDEVTVTITY